MASAPTAQEALRAWLNLLPPDQRRAAESAMGAGWPASAEASDEPTPAEASDEPTPSPSQADPATTPIPEEPSPILLAQREWYDSQDKIFMGPIPPETPLPFPLGFLGSLGGVKGVVLVRFGGGGGRRGVRSLTAFVRR